MLYVEGDYMTYKILIVDDEFDILDMLREYFEQKKYVVYTADCGKSALEKIEIQPDVILLDINMPGYDGFEVCGKIRNYIDCPIIFLTAKVEEADKIKGLSIGGDDYVIKPFSIDELGARVAAHLRRQHRQSVVNTIKFDNNLVIDYTKHQVYYNDKPIIFAKKEFEIIALLSQNPNQPFDKERIYEKIWGYESVGDSSLVVERIRRIRVKFAALTDVVYIETIWGVGYKWRK